MFTARGETVQWAEMLHNKPVLVQRGSFRPVTTATVDVQERALEQFVSEADVRGEDPAVLMEMTLRHLSRGDQIEEKDFLQRADTLGALGRTVLISNFRRFHRLAYYLGRYTDRPIGLALGASKLAEIFDESFYNNKEGGLLGGLGLLFKNPGRLYVYPSLDEAAGAVITAENFAAPAHLKHLYAHLLQNGSIRGVRNSRADLLPIRARIVLEEIQAGNPDWEKKVPPAIVEVVKRKQLFGYAEAVVA